MSEPGLDFDLGEMADTIRDTTRRFATDKIAPIAAKIDETDEFPRELWPQMGELGLHGITVEEEYGGLGLGYLEHVVAQEEVARASASVGLSYGAHSNLCVNQIRRGSLRERALHRAHGRARDRKDDGGIFSGGGHGTAPVSVIASAAKQSSRIAASLRSSR